MSRLSELRQPDLRVYNNDVIIEWQRTVENQPGRNWDALKAALRWANAQSEITVMELDAQYQALCQRL